MKIKIKEMRKKDHKKAIKAAIQGMHLNWYIDNALLLNLYGRYFWYLELTRSTQIIAAYVGDEFAGVLLADMKGERKLCRSYWKMLYVKIFDFLQKHFYKDSVGMYNNANRELYLQYLENHSPDGEIIFLAANPEISIKGIGSKLLNELERREKGKQIYLYTDSGCTYQFYEHRGFECFGKKDIIWNSENKKDLLQCLLYSKVL